MDRVRFFITKEIEQFSLLSLSARYLLVASFLFNAMDTIVYLFFNLFIWQGTKDFAVISLFNIASAAGLIAGFLINGYLLRWYSLSRGLQIGFIIRMIFLGFLVAFSQKLLLVPIFLGIIVGVSSSFYWGTYTTLVSFATTDKERNYFTGLRWILNETASFIVPIISGILITNIGVSIFRLDLLTSYTLVFALALIFSFFGLWVSMRVNVRERMMFSLARHRSIGKLTHGLSSLRMYVFIMGLMEGVTVFLPAIISLSFFGNERSVGILAGFGALSGIVTAYFLGKTSPHARPRILAVGSVLYGAAGVGIGMFFTKWVYIAYFILLYISSSLLWGLWYPVLVSVWEKANVDLERRYHFTFDAEVFLDIGRIIATIFFLFLSFTIAPPLLFRVSLLIFGIVPLLLNIYYQKLLRR